jgi:hypothetical protein
MKGDKTMKKLILITLIMMVTVSFLVAGSTNADAMNNESAALLTAGIVLLSIPVMNAVVHGGTSPEPVYSHAGPPRYIEKTHVVYVQSKNTRHPGRRITSYKRGYRQEWKRLQHERGKRDARRDYRRDRHYDR